MATLFPPQDADFTTKGEQAFYHFLEKVALPHNDYLVWYSPQINEREPDFVLFSPNSGLIIFEVKDWALSQIKEANPALFTLQMGNALKTHKNPLKQAKEYRFALLNALKRETSLNIPIHEAVVFPNICRADFINHNLDTVIPSSFVLCSDDLQESSPFYQSKDYFTKWLTKNIPALFPFFMQRKDIDTLRYFLYPTVRIEKPTRASNSFSDMSMSDFDMSNLEMSNLDMYGVVQGEQSQEYKNFVANTHKLDVLGMEQEHFARTFQKGSRLIIAPAGCGKTLILIHHAVYLYKQCNVKRILFVCYNLSLVGYLKRLLALKGVPLGKNGIEILPFYDVCNRIVETAKLENSVLNKLDKIEKPKDYYQSLINTSIDVLDDSPMLGYYDAILVDEGQDFSAPMVRIIWSLLKQSNASLCVASDSLQSIYNKGENPWQSIPYIECTQLTKQYRNTKAISDFAYAFLEKYSIDTKSNFADTHKQAFALSHPFFDNNITIENSEVLGAENKKIQESNETTQEGLGQNKIAPKECFCSENNIVSETVNIVSTWIEKGIPMSEIAVLYAYSNIGDTQLPQQLFEELENKGILCSWVAEDDLAKRRYDITANSVTLSTIHSVKGMDYAHVALILPNPERQYKNRPHSESHLKLAFVGMTRARLELGVFWY